MSTRRNALGRGLGALIPAAPSAQAAPSLAVADAAPAPEADRTGSVVEIPLDAIDPNPEQPRRRFEPEPLQALAASIREHGVLQPVVVRRAGERFELIVGERRWRASREAGLASLPAVVADAGQRELLEMALVENVQRHDLNPIELAHAFQALAETGASQEQIGRRVSLDRSTIANHLRLLELARGFQEDVEEGRLSTGHAKALLQLTNPERRRRLRDRIVSERLSVRAAEELARRAAPAPRTPRRRPSPRDPDLERVADALRRRLQTRVRLAGDGRRGRIEIEYFSAEDLERLVALLLGDA